MNKNEETRDLFAAWVEGNETEEEAEEGQEEEQSTRDKFADWAKEKI